MFGCVRGLGLRWLQGSNLKVEARKRSSTGNPSTDRPKSMFQLSGVHYTVLLFCLYTLEGFQRYGLDVDLRFGSVGHVVFWGRKLGIHGLLGASGFWVWDA